MAWGGPNIESWARPVAQRGQEMAPERRCSTEEFRPSGARAVRGQMDAASTPPSACLMCSRGAAMLLQWALNPAGSLWNMPTRPS